MKTKERVGDNLYKVTFDGTRSYYYVVWRENGKNKEKSLGRTELLTLREAKRLAAALMVASNDQEPEQPPAPVINHKVTFGEIYNKAIDDIGLVKQWKNPKSDSQWRNTIKTYALPVFGDKAVDKIDREDILAALKPIWFTKTATAGKLHQRLDAIFSWAIVKKIRTGSNPASWKDNLMFSLPAKSKIIERTHHEAPTIEELKKVVRYCLEHPCAGSAALLFCIATVSRVGEVLQATREQIDGDVWLSPEENQKIARGDRRVPLSKLAMEGLKMSANQGPLFVGYTGRRIALDYPRLRLKKLIGRDVTIHGIRSTFRDWAAENGVSDAVAEKILSHQWGDQTTEAYYRTDLLDQRRAVLEKWAKAVL